MRLAGLARGCGYMGGRRVSTYTSQRSTSCAVGSSDLSVVGGMERESVAEGVCVVGRWSAKGDGLVGDSGLCDVYGWRLELSQARGDAKVARLHCQLVWSLTCGDARCELTLQLTKHQNPNN